MNVYYLENGNLKRSVESNVNLYYMPQKNKACIFLDFPEQEQIRIELNLLQVQKLLTDTYRVSQRIKRQTHKKKGI